MTAPDATWLFAVGGAAMVMITSWLLVTGGSDGEDPRR
jgi:hypothetical protein